MSNDVYSAKEVAAMCGVSSETIRRWIRKLGLRAYNTTGGLAIKILGDDLANFADDNNIFVDWTKEDQRGKK